MGNKAMQSSLSGSYQPVVEPGIPMEPRYQSTEDHKHDEQVQGIILISEQGQSYRLGQMVKAKDQLDHSLDAIIIGYNAKKHALRVHFIDFVENNDEWIYAPFASRITLNPKKLTSKWVPIYTKVGAWIKFESGLFQSKAQVCFVNEADNTCIIALEKPWKLTRGKEGDFLNPVESIWISFADVRAKVHQPYSCTPVVSFQHPRNPYTIVDETFSQLLIDFLYQASQACKPDEKQLVLLNQSGEHSRDENLHFGMDSDQFDPTTNDGGGASNDFKSFQPKPNDTYRPVELIYPILNIQRPQHSVAVNSVLQQSINPASHFLSFVEEYVSQKDSVEFAKFMQCLKHVHQVSQFRNSPILHIDELVTMFCNALQSLSVGRLTNLMCLLETVGDMIAVNANANANVASASLTSAATTTSASTSSTSSTFVGTTKDKPTSAFWDQLKPTTLDAAKSVKPIFRLDFQKKHYQEILKSLISVIQSQHTQCLKLCLKFCPDLSHYLSMDSHEFLIAIRNSKDERVIMALLSVPQVYEELFVRNRFVE